jgi:Ca2+-binding RTX toxin-like protein
MAAMATFTFYDGLDRWNTIGAVFDHTTLTLSGLGDTATLTDGNGAQIVLTGTGFGYAEVNGRQALVVGEVSNLTLRAANGDLAFTVSDASADGNSLFQQIIVGHGIHVDFEAEVLWGADNIVFGQSDGGLLYSGASNDMLYGGAGRDRFQSGQGHDTLTGGAGADKFNLVFVQDTTITDFTNSGRRNQQDHMELTRHDYRHMTLDQMGDDTVITLAADDRQGLTERTITLLDVEVADLGRSDFLFYNSFG